MLATVPTSILVGVEGSPITVEVLVASGLPAFSIVGLPDASCRESRDRVRAAVVSSGLQWPRHRVTVNLAPTGLRKGGAALDLPIAVALLVADGQLDAELVSDTAFLGELGLDGTVRRVPGVLSLVDAVATRTVVVPAASAAEAQLVGGRRVRGASSLRGLVAALRGEEDWPRLPGGAGAPAQPVVEPDLADVRGQALGRAAVEVCAAGGHHLLLVGPPGAGKTMLATRLAGLLPPLGMSQALEVTRVHSAAGLALPADGLVRRPPFRAPHHGASAVSLIGGGSGRMRPGEISCAHGGVLFLDEMAEFPADVLDALRQPLEEGTVLVCRARASVVFPARFLLVGAMNPCPCGQGRPGWCRCTERQRARYGERISGPLLDRFDVRVHVERADPAELLADLPAPAQAEPSAVVAARVAEVRRLASRRGVTSNAELPAEQLDAQAPLSADARRLLEVRLRQGRLSARGLHRVRRVARTVADLSGRDGIIGPQDVRTALGLRGEVFAAVGEAS